MELAHHVLTVAGVATIDYSLTAFAELIPGLLDGRWQMSTAMFITEERAALVDFSRAIWAARDGLIVRPGDAARLRSYESIARDAMALLAVVRGTIQRRTALDAGIPEHRIVEYPDQGTAAAAVREGRVAAFASTAIGNRAYVESGSGLAAVADEPIGSRAASPRGAFGFSMSTPDLTAIVNSILDRYLGSPEHQALMAHYGFTSDELPPALGRMRQGRPPRVRRT